MKRGWFHAFRPEKSIAMPASLQAGRSRLFACSFCMGRIMVLLRPVEFQDGKE
jgi:hypothetical protein